MLITRKNEKMMLKSVRIIKMGRIFCCMQKTMQEKVSCMCV
jgi:hypothetical protein